MLQVLVACEFSAVVRDAFANQGHYAWSCDLLPSDAQYGNHYQGDVREILNEAPWDLLIAHPPCTYLSNSGVRWLHTQPKRWMDMIEGAAFFRDLLLADVPHVAVENPIMHKYAATIIGERQTQLVQPWMFGHPEKKGTGLWLRNLPPLSPTEDVKHLMADLPSKESSRVHWASPGEDRWKERSVTLQGVAEAMAKQWTEEVLDKQPGTHRRQTT